MGGPKLGLEGTLPARISFVLGGASGGPSSRVPLFRRVSEPPATGAPAPLGAVVRDAFAQVGRTLKDLRAFPQAFMLLLAFLIYNDGIQTIIRMATIYGEELKLDRTVMIAAIVLVQFVGIPFAFLFGWLGGRIGTRPAIFLGIAGYVVITFLGWRLSTTREFLMLAGARRDGAGRHAGAQPLALRPDDPGVQVGRVLRLLRHLREVRGDLRAPALLPVRVRHRLEPDGDPLDARCSSWWAPCCSPA